MGQATTLQPARPVWQTEGTTVRFGQQDARNPNNQASPVTRWPDKSPYPHTPDTVTLSRMKTAEDSKGLIVKPALEENVNDMGHVDAGHLAKLIDVVGAVPAFRHVDGKNTFVTAAIDRTDFINPIRTWELIEMESRITRVWNTSLETQVKVNAIDWRHGEMKRRHVATAYLVMAHLDANREKAKLPPLALASLEDVQLAAEADLRRQNRSREFKEIPFTPMDASDTPFAVENLRLMTKKETNVQGNVFGGIILEEIERAARKAAQKQALQGVVTGVRMDRMNFIAPGFEGETIRTRATVTKTWNTSMEIQVEAEAINPNQPDQPRKIASSYMVFVKLGPDGNPSPVPQWIPQTDPQKTRAEAADKRRHNREEEKKASESLIHVALSPGQRFVLGLRSVAKRLERSLKVLTGND